jgi:peptidoglycan hydrolase CwlO-like protein
MNWFSKWGFNEELPMDDVYKRISDLEIKVQKLEEENMELINDLYRMENSLDSRIDILADHMRINGNV